MSELACFRRLRTSSCPRYQPFDANPDQTTDWHLAESNRFCEIFDELLSTQKMLEVIPPNHAVKIRVTRSAALRPRSLLRRAQRALLKQLRPHPK